MGDICDAKLNRLFIIIKYYFIIRNFQSKVKSRNILEIIFQSLPGPNWLVIRSFSDSKDNT